MAAVPHQEQLTGRNWTKSREEIGPGRSATFAISIQDGLIKGHQDGGKRLLTG